MMIIKVAAAVVVAEAAAVEEAAEVAQVAAEEAALQDLALDHHAVVAAEEAAAVEAAVAETEPVPIAPSLLLRLIIYRRDASELQKGTEKSNTHTLFPLLTSISLKHILQLGGVERLHAEGR